ncbi:MULTISPECIES: cell division protein ZapE [unclassified Vibrio]|uniref:Cell division protein ZapE n=1 Tax=Vibrio sp. HB236076 TaxID=3232307 RepID=A0AB39HCH7_9VIBR|nr:cell division protein ZapE [Vibrio sp. HB161653]MDP5254527.1 cell division protein ZapE [Vibrio sp. HB161653]
MTPLTHYQHDIEHNGFHADETQQQAVLALEQLYQQMVEYWQQPIPEKPKGVSRLWRKTPPAPKAPLGLYFWGGVGRGKTYLMDVFFESLPNERKTRVHFHHFMQKVHHELGLLKDQVDPLLTVAKRFKQQADIICFDEFFVSDITDAMILGTLFEAMFAEDMVLVATSNIEPENLYRNGLQRARFLPAIELIKQRCQVMNVDSGVDYRLRTLEQAEIYHWPLDDAAEQQLKDTFQSLTQTRVPQQGAVVDINHRQLEVLGAEKGVLMASFAQLCQTARSQNDYIELAKRYHTVLLVDVIAMDEKVDDAARRFIALVDEFYECNVVLMMSAQVALTQLYQGGRLAFEFQRCQSRLIEMQSKDYLHQGHLSLQ